MTAAFTAARHASRRRETTLAPRAWSFAALPARKPACPAALTLLLPHPPSTLAPRPPRPPRPCRRASMRRSSPRGRRC
eukprot:6989183-Prymnesium_polylepis.1